MPQNSKVIQIMGNVATIPAQGQILVDIEDISSYERSLCDLDEGRVYKYDSLDDLIKEIEGCTI